jgi:uncharacterized cofD-like protein
VTLAVTLDADLPLKVVAIGGGTGLAALLRAVKAEADRVDNPWQLTGIVTVSDNGGSSGRLRDELGSIPPGDLRNCLSALTRGESILSNLLNYRFYGKGTLTGHSLGNLILLAMADITGDWVQAIRKLSGVLVTVGRLYPSTAVPTVLWAEDENGRIYCGETAINTTCAPLKKFWMEPSDVEPLPEAMLSILQSDLILLAPGSLYTSTVASLLITELSSVIVRTNKPVIYVANLMTEPNESIGMDLEAHVATIQAFANMKIHTVIANTTPLPSDLLLRYKNEGGLPLLIASSSVCGVPVVSEPLLDSTVSMARHDPILLNKAIKKVIKTL